MFDNAVVRSSKEINAAMARVFGYMGLSVVVSMVVAALVGNNPALMAFLFSGITAWIVILAPLAAILVVSFAFEKFSKQGLIVFMQVFAALMGLSFSTIFAVYELGSIVSAFMGAAVLFGVLSVYGYFTKTNLDNLGSFMFAGLIAIIIASVINLFIGSTLAQMIISAIAIVVFLGLTAYDVQKIRELVSTENDGRGEIMGAIALYLDFINIFLNLLQLFGQRK